MTTVAKKDEFDLGIDMSDMMVIMMMIVMMSLLTGVAGTVASGTQAAQAYTGLTDSRTLLARPAMQWINLVSDPPYIPWITGYFFNDGPQSAFIAVNNPGELSELAVGEDTMVDMTGADRRIEFVFYRTNPGEGASVRVLGKY